VIVITVYLPNGPGVIQDLGNVTHAALIANGKVCIEAEDVGAGPLDQFAAPENGKATKALAAEK
jgi:hypothetical protein